MPATAKPKLYNPHNPQRTLLYQTVAEHYQTWLELACSVQFDGQGDHHSPKPYVRKAFEKYLECSIFAHGFARARRRRTSPTTSSPDCPCASGCYRCRNGCGTSCSEMARCWAWNEHVHFHVCAVDGVFEEVAGGQEGKEGDGAGASCALSLLGACWRVLRLKRCWHTGTAASR